jgi:hypothetical protein
MNRLAGFAFLLLTAPLWAIGLVLVPVYLVERFCYWTCRRALYGVTRAARESRAPLSARDRYFAKSRNARRAHKAVRL